MKETTTVSSSNAQPEKAEFEKGMVLETDGKKKVVICDLMDETNVIRKEETHNG